MLRREPSRLPLTTEHVEQYRAMKDDRRVGFGIAVAVIAEL